ncbi:cell division protein ZapD [Rhodocyclus tenuis]|uniref:Cell division protein ZapD n=2 Tax=Rhodocyclus TaxID=1064 RepID=A0A6L5JYR1_RHOTE|nr:cell division protein ZapD [Rhodocyclus gracilis]MRD72369.1 cell division protein ZapD [Rhodocyclus gracilis]NJA89545.1 cell division protein ZapD [Rhodocyclus gracilis]
MITYEYPFNERIRTLLRLEDLFDKSAHFMQNDGALEHHVALVTLFEILEVAGRADLKLDLIQELERQRQTLIAYRNNPDISEEALSGALYEIEQASAALLSMTGKIGQHLRENDWLMSIRSRAAIPGGVCEFDLPSYHFWLNQTAEQRRRALDAWIKPLLPLRDGLVIVLRLLRASGHPEENVAKGGAFQLMLGGSTTQMVRVSVKLSDAYVPEISANKYALNIRFARADGDHRPRPCDSDVDFDLTFCNL